MVLRSGPVPGYLNKHSEADARDAVHLHGYWNQAVAIPACAEDSRFEETLKSLASADGANETLLVLVVNGAEDSAEETHLKNQEFLDWIRGTLDLGIAPFSLGRYEELDVLLVDRASPGHRLPKGQGVGLARKISVDIPLALHSVGRIKSPWFHTTDADVVVPKDYLSRIPTGDYAAAIFPYRHVLEGGETQQEAMLEYEAYLRYYVEGLAFAGSPYAYPSIGSTIAVRADAYAAVRGFPKRLAGEDFYLLNKLAKIAPIYLAEGEPIEVRGRYSKRVPFGTGAALYSIVAEHEQGEVYGTYDPRCFELLNCFLKAWHGFCQDPSLEAFQAAIRNDDCFDGKFYELVDSQGSFDAALSASKRTEAGAPLARRLNEWFDGFRTLKFLHGVRDAFYPQVPLMDALREAPFTSVEASMGLEDVGLVQAQNAPASCAVGPTREWNIPGEGS